MCQLWTLGYFEMFGVQCSRGRTGHWVHERNFEPERHWMSADDAQRLGTEDFPRDGTLACDNRLGAGLWSGWSFPGNRTIGNESGGGALKLSVRLHPS